MTMITKLIHDNYYMANLINTKSCNHNISDINDCKRNHLCNHKNKVQCTLKGIQIQLKRNRMQIVAQGIENMLIISIILDYGVEKHFSIPSITNSKLKFILVRRDY